MRKLLVGLVAVAALAPSGVALATTDAQDAKACKAKDQVEQHTTQDNVNPADRDRFSVCVRQQGHVVVYAGGEAQSENSHNVGFQHTCGSVIVADQTVAETNAGDNWSAGTNHC